METHTRTENGFEERFRIRSYTKSELACAYMPHCNPRTAINILRRWFETNKPMMAELYATGYTLHTKCLTPAQVAIVVKHLGEP